MIDALIFDIGNVLLRFDFGVAIAKLQPLCTHVAEGPLLAPLETVKNDYEAGRISRAAFLAQAFELLGYRGSEAAFVQAWEEIFEVNEPMVQWMEQLHATGKPLYLLSNTSDIHVDHMLAVYPFFGRFRDAVYSYRVGCSKPDRAIYALAAKQFGVDPERTLFIDDLAVNIEAARAERFRAIRYDFRDHAAFLREVSGLVA